MKSLFFSFAFLPMFAFASIYHPAQPNDYGRAGAGGYLGECPAEKFEHLVGESGSLAQWLSADGNNVRIVIPGRAYTMEYIPDRLNIHLDDKGVIERVSCG